MVTQSRYLKSSSPPSLLTSGTGNKSIPSMFGRGPVQSGGPNPVPTGGNQVNWSMNQDQLREFGFSDDDIFRNWRMSQISPASQMDLEGAYRQSLAQKFGGGMRAELELLYKNRYGQATQDAKNRGLYNSTEGQRQDRLVDSNYLRDKAGVEDRILQVLMGAYGGERSANITGYQEAQKAAKRGSRAATIGSIAKIIPSLFGGGG